MPVEGFYYTYGDDADMIEKKWLPDIEKRYAKAAWLRYDATIDELHIGNLVTEYQTNDLFSQGKVIVIRNADAKQAQVEALAEELLTGPRRGSALVLIASSWNKTTRLGKIVKDKFVVKELVKPEQKPFDLIDALNTKNATMVMRHSDRLFETDYNPLAMFSLIFGHFLLLRQIYEKRRQSSEEIARELKQHAFRIKKAMVAFRYWDKVQLDEALRQLGELDRLLRTWRYDEKMLLQMYLIKLTL